MYAQMKCSKQYASGWQRSAMAVVVAVVLSSSYLVGVQAAEAEVGNRAMQSMKDGDKAMNSMDMHKSMMKGMKDMEAMRASGDTDHDFAMMMKMHHQSALDMANVQLRDGKDSKMRSMAKGIIKSQEKEIKEFDQWLAKHKQPMAAPMPKR